MALTRSYRETVLERIRQDPEFTAALYAEALNALVEGDKATTLSILRDLVHAHVSFKQLAAITGSGEKALHRMLGAKGNPTTENLSKIMHAIEQDLHLQVEISAKVSRESAGAKDGPAVAYA